MEPLFSVIIPVYNVAPELKRAVKSVQVQGFTDWEIVLIDDGSTDGSGELCDELAKADSRIRVLHQANAGVVAARQNGFLSSSGQWILFLDGDDEFEPDTFDILSTYIIHSAPEAQILKYGYVQMLYDGNMIRHCSSFTGTFDVMTLISQMKKTPLEFLDMCIGNKCYRRDVVALTFKSIGDVHISHSEDGLFAFAAFLRVNKVHFFNKCLYRYILRPRSAVHRINKKIVFEKELFIQTLNSLARDCCKMSENEIIKMLDFHSYQAACYIFLMLARNGASAKEYIEILNTLNHASFFTSAGKEWTGLKRRLMRFLIRHPRFYFVSRIIGRIV